MRLHLSLIALLLSLGLLAVGCTPVRGGGDDDDNGDDDDSADDDDASDDDDATDDDDASDDDDAADELTFGSADITGDFFVSYFSDMDATVDLCQQHFEFSGVANVGTWGATCPLCSGQVQLFNIQDVTSSSVDVALPCDPTNHFPEQVDVGDQFASADLLQDWALVWINDAVENAIVVGTTSASELQTNYADQGAQLIFLVYMEPVSGGFMELFDWSAAPPPPGSSLDLVPMMTMYNGEGAPADRIDGSNGLGGVWRFSFQDAPGYQSVLISGAFDAAFEAD